MSQNELPFNEGTKIYQIFMLLCDFEWHCGKHELPGTQPAKAIQIIRQNGYIIENSTRSCEICHDKTVHRRLVSKEPLTPSINRTYISNNLRKRVLSLYNNTESVSLRKITAELLKLIIAFLRLGGQKMRSCQIICQMMISESIFSFSQGQIISGKAAIVRHVRYQENEELLLNKLFL